jgi:hypothetical protein
MKLNAKIYFFLTPFPICPYLNGTSTYRRYNKGNFET